MVVALGDHEGERRRYQQEDHGAHDGYPARGHIAGRGSDTRRAWGGAALRYSLNVVDPLQTGMWASIAMYLSMNPSFSQMKGFKELKFSCGVIFSSSGCTGYARKSTAPAFFAAPRDRNTLAPSLEQSAVNRRNVYWLLGHI